MTNVEELKEKIDLEYDLDQGFLGRLREGQFDEAGAARLIGLLESLDLPDDDPIDRRLVQLLWFMPTFLDWQKARVPDSAAALGVVQTKVINAIEEAFGMP